VAWALVCSVGIGIVYLLHDQYGATWDEPVQSMYGDLVVSYFRSGGVDRRCDEFLDLRYYGPLADLIPSAIHPANDLGKYRLRHMVCGLFALGALGVTGWAGWRLRGGMAGAGAVVALAMMPRFVGHAFDNLKDVPFAATFAAFVVAVAAMWVGRGARWKRVVGAGAAAGLVLAVRPGGFPIVMAMLVASALVARVTVCDGDPDRGVSPLGGVLGVLVIGWVVMVLPWPYAHQDPIRHPIEAMVVARSFPYARDVLFDGAAIASVNLPRSYVARMLLVTTPPLLLVLAGIGLWVSARTWTSRRGSDVACVTGIVMAWMVVPLAGMAIMRPNVYDGVRHVLFVLPAMAILAGLGGVAVFEACTGRVRALVASAVLAGVLLTGVELVRLHPYQTAYFNAFVGGLAGAEGRFDTDYWVSSYREAFEWVNERARREPDRSFQVLVAGTSYLSLLAELYRAPNVRARVVEEIGPEVTLPPGTDYAIATYRWGFAKRLFREAPVVHAIGREGAVFTVIRGRRPL